MSDSVPYSRELAATGGKPPQACDPRTGFPRWEITPPGRAGAEEGGPVSEDLVVVNAARRWWLEYMPGTSRMPDDAEVLEAYAKRSETGEPIMRDDLVAFLRKRLDEVEAAAEAAAEDAPAPWRADGNWVLDSEDHGFMVDELTLSSATAAHIARHDPARMLREVELKRVVLAEHEPEPWGEPHPELLRCTQGHGDEYWTVWPCAEVRALAAVFSDHPDYREEWKP